MGSAFCQGGCRFSRSSRHRAQKATAQVRSSSDPPFSLGAHWTARHCVFGTIEAFHGTTYNILGKSD